MHKLYVLICVIFLSACSMDGIVENSVPETVRADNTAHIDRLLAKDASRMAQAFNLDMEDGAIQKQIEGVLNNVPDGKEIRRDYVGVTTASSVALGEGKSRDITLVTEVQTSGGFMMVTSQYALAEDGTCCALSNINVKKSDTSPMREGLIMMGKIASFVGLFLVLMILGASGSLIFWQRRKKRKRLER